MTSKDGGGPHPGDPWHPDWESPVPATEAEEEWPYDESLTLSTAELEVAGIEDEEDAEEPAAEVDATEVDAVEDTVQPDGGVPEVGVPEAEVPDGELAESEGAAEVEATAVEEVVEVEAEAEVVEERAAEAEQVEEVVEPAEPEVAEVAEVEEVEEPAAEVEAAEVDAAEDTVQPDGGVPEVGVPVGEVPDGDLAEWEGAAQAEMAEVEEVEERAAETEAAEVVDVEAEPELVEERAAEAEVVEEVVEPPEAEVAEIGEVELEVEAGATEDVVEAAAEEAAAEVGLAEGLVADAGLPEGAVEPERAAPEVEIPDVEIPEAEAGEREPAIGEPQLAAVAPEEPGVAEIEEASAESASAEMFQPDDDAVSIEVEEIVAAEPVAPVIEEPELTVAEVEDEVARDIEDAVDHEVEDIELEELEGDAEWLGSVEELTLDVEDVDGHSERPTTLSAVPDADQPAHPAPADVPSAEWTVEDVPFEVVDLDDQDLRADTAEHYFEALDFADEVDHDHITAEIPAAEPRDAVDVIPIVRDPGGADVAEPAAAEPFEVPAEYDHVAASVDETRHALAAFMKPWIAAPVEEVAESPAEPAAADLQDAATPVEPSGQLTIPTDPAGMEPQPLDADQLAGATDPADEEPVDASLDWALTEGDPQPLLADEPETPEEEIVAELTEDLDIINFETFVRSELQEQDYVQAPTQEHLGLAEEISEAAASAPSAVAAAMPGVEQGHVGFDEFDEDLEFHDPDREEPAADGADEDQVERLEPAEDELYESDLTLRVASALVLASLLVGALWAGGVAFLLFIGVVAIAGQIEFYNALRKGGYRPMVLFGLLGGIGALVGTYVQGDDLLTEAPIAVPAALALTVVATFAWYGSQETPPREPWSNGIATVFAVAWIPALLAFILPVIETPRSTRFQLVFVLLVMVAAFDIGSYFVGRALGNRKLSPVVSPNKTVEGLIGGVVAAIVVALIAAAVASEFDAGTALALAAGVIIASPLGDLAESVVKRSLNLKDMGQLIPGHGGILDRIDSYLFVVPVAYLVFRWTGLI